MSDMEPDLTHREMRDDLLARLEAAREESKRADGVLAERLETIFERLDAGGGRFSAIEQMLAQAAKDRAAYSARLDQFVARLIAIETAREIVAGVDKEVADRAERWRKRVLAVLIFIFGQGGLTAILIWWFQRNPPTSPGL